MHPILNTAVKAARRAFTAVKAARRAGALINRAQLAGALGEVRAKRPNDFVTEVDRAAEQEIVDLVKRAYPEHAILAEESGATPGNRRAEYRWIVDPLDGTTNFIHGYPQYCVSIAVQHRGQLAHSVVYDMNRNELFTASKGRGAFLNDRRIRVSKCVRLKDALVATGFPFREMKRLGLYMRQLEAVISRSKGQRRGGAAALDLAWVACGRVDAFWELGLAPWDMAAGALLVLEAGGLVGDTAGEQDWLESGDITAASPKVYPGLLEALR